MRSASGPATSPRSSPTPCPNGCYADMGILCAGGVSSGIYPTDSAAQVEYLVNDSRTKVIFAEDEEQLDKILSCRARCPTLEKIVVFDMEGLSGFSDPMVMSLAEFMALGSNHIAGPRGAVGRDGRKPRRRRSRDPGLHLGHHRAAQGRDAFQPQRHPSDAPRQRSVSRPPTMKSGWCSCRSAMSPSGSAAITFRWRWDR